MSTIMTITTPVTKLRGSNDWPQWYTRLRHLCPAHDCWDFVNPSTEDVPTKPQRSTMDEFADEEARNIYMVERDNYIHDKEDYKDVKRKLTSIATWIFTCLDDGTREDLVDKSHRPREMVLVLKDRFSPSTAVDKDAYRGIGGEFIALLNHPRSPNLEAWIHDMIRVVKRLYKIRDPLHEGAKFDFYLANFEINEGPADRLWEADDAKTEGERASFEEFAGRFLRRYRQ